MANKRDKSKGDGAPVDRSDPDYKVGYKRPPRGRPFAPGHSGNPKGKPKGHKNLLTYIDEELAVPVEITEHGKRKTIIKVQAVAKQLVNGAASGNLKSVLALVAREMARNTSADASAPVEFKVTEADAQVLKAALERINGNEEPEDLKTVGQVEEGGDDDEQC